MLRSQLKDMSGTNGVNMNASLPRAPTGSAASGASGNAPSIPSLKRTLSGGSAQGLGHSHTTNHAHAHSLVGPGQLNMSAISSVLQSNPSTSPPQMLRATTSTGVFNRPMPTVTNPSAGGTSRAPTNATSVVSGATTVPTATRSVTQTTMQDWRMYMTIEERQAVRSKIRDAYTTRCTSYEELLQVACAIEEELLHISAPSRLDYFKSGFEFENRVKLKNDQLQGQLTALDSKRRGGSSPNPTATNASSNSTTSSSNPSGSPTSHDAGMFAKKQRI